MAIRRKNTNTDRLADAEAAVNDVFALFAGAAESLSVAQQEFAEVDAEAQRVIDSAAARQARARDNRSQSANLAANLDKLVNGVL